jgi:hypothetical protein
MIYPPLTEARRLLLQTRYDKAEISYDLLANGKAVEQFVDQNGEQVKYTKTTLEALAAYMQSLYAQLNPGAARQGWSRPTGFTF